MDGLEECIEDLDSRKEATSNLEYPGPLTETIVIGNLAIRLQALQRELNWDDEKMEITNIDADKQNSLPRTSIKKLIKSLILKQNMTKTMLWHLRVK